MAILTNLPPVLPMIHPLKDESRPKMDQARQDDAQQAEALRTDLDRAAGAQQALKQTGSKASLLAQQMVEAGRQISEANQAIATFVKQEGQLPKGDVATKADSGLDRPPSPEGTVETQEPASTIPAVADKNPAPDTTKTSAEDHSGRSPKLPHELAGLAEKLGRLTKTLCRTNPDQLAKALKTADPTMAKVLLAAKDNLVKRAEVFLKNLQKAADRAKASDPQGGVEGGQVETLKNVIESVETLLKTLDASEAEGLPEGLALKGQKAPDSATKSEGGEKAGKVKFLAYTDATEAKQPEALAKSIEAPLDLRQLESGSNPGAKPSVAATSSPTTAVLVAGGHGKENTPGGDANDPRKRSRGAGLRPEEVGTGKEFFPGQLPGAYALVQG